MSEPWKARESRLEAAAEQEAWKAYELPLDLAHLDDLRQQITQADEAIVSFICLRVQLGREELAYRRERGLPEWDRKFEFREAQRMRAHAAAHADPIPIPELDDILCDLAHLVIRVAGAVDDGRVDPATDAIPY